MENYIEGRILLGSLCIIHLLVIYGIQYPWGHIRDKVLGGIILTELIGVTAYVIYDNLQTPPQDGWFLAIIGYILVYSLILMTWLGYLIFTLLDKDKIYEMTIAHHVCIQNAHYLQGTVIERKHKIPVILPILPYSSELHESNIKPKVKFDNVFRGMYIVVKRV